MDKFAVHIANTEHVRDKTTFLSIERKVKGLFMNKKNEITLMNVLFCLIVIFIHVSSAPISLLNKQSLQFAAVFIPWRLSSFVVYGFILLSGVKLFLKKEDKINYKKYYSTRFTHIVLPYILWVVVYYIYFCQHHYFEFHIVDLIKYILIGNLSSHFYFVIAIIQFYLLVPVWRAWFRRFHPMLTIVISLLITSLFGQFLPKMILVFFPNFNFVHNDKLFTSYLVYWTIGCFIGLYYDTFKTILKENRSLVSVFFVFSTVLNISFSYLNMTGKKNIPFLETIQMMYVLSTIIFIYMVAVKLAEKTKLTELKLIQLIDSSSYLIYLSHVLVLIVVNEYLLKFEITGIAISYLFRIFFVYTITVSACVAWRLLRTKLSRRHLQK